MITLAKWKAVQEAELEEENDENIQDDFNETQEEVVKEADKGEMLVFRRALSG